MRYHVSFIIRLSAPCILKKVRISVINGSRNEEEGSSEAEVQASFFLKVKSWPQPAKNIYHNKYIYIYSNLPDSLRSVCSILHYTCPSV